MAEFKTYDKILTGDNSMYNRYIHSNLLLSVAGFLFGGTSIFFLYKKKYDGFIVCFLVFLVFYTLNITSYLYTYKQFKRNPNRKYIEDFIENRLKNKHRIFFEELDEHNFCVNSKEFNYDNYLSEIELSPSLNYTSPFILNIQHKFTFLNYEAQVKFNEMYINFVVSSDGHKIYPKIENNDIIILYSGDNYNYNYNYISHLILSCLLLGWIYNFNYLSNFKTKYNISLKTKIGI